MPCIKAMETVGFAAGVDTLAMEAQSGNRGCLIAAPECTCSLLRFSQPPRAISAAAAQAHPCLSTFSSDSIGYLALVLVN